MWYAMLLTAIATLILVHFVAAMIALGHLKKHRIGRFVPLVIITLGLIPSALATLITSAAIAGVYQTSGNSMKILYGVAWGVGQTIVLIFISFTRILATL
ncbi:hypothetical protein HELRODRAFT_76173 [Helobdella robusta]|uniref:Transmembrane protein 170A n=1 Tax=Helobdella robusta TaxID=6412 RepID=T1G2G2_HELRO|nr:hypothetical protein HELRODRAFT_76173 [Helobdella robusta]ESO07798.1 hypothetical protein HELRODRAFT_76173 [Helobdella robusta]